MRQRLTEQERQERSQQLQKTLTLLVHACSCHDPQCNSTSCRKVGAGAEQLRSTAQRGSQLVNATCTLGFDLLYAIMCCSMVSPPVNPTSKQA
jgi:hypothetical protein